MEAQMKTVPYNVDTIMKCQCTSCPVQHESSCVMGKVQAMSGMMEKMRTMMMPGEQGMSDMMLPSAEDMPGLYCSTGTATCGDLDYSMGCICMTCQVYLDNVLDNSKYCSKGSAAQVG
jgi:hypothetical protein